MSIVLNFGIAELKCPEKPNVIRLLEILNQLQPFIGTICQDEGFRDFLQNIWAYSIRTGASDIVSKIVEMYPSQVDLLIDKLINSELSESEILFASENFNQLTSIINLPAVFRHVSLRLAEINVNTSKISQILLNSILKFLKSKLSKNKFLSLYPVELRSVATVLNEAIHAEDQLVLNLINSVKAESHIHFILLVTHFPLFIHLKQ